MNRAGAVIDLDCNVNIKVLDKYRRVVRNSSIHNKATVNLVDGILRFIKGDFTKTSYSDSLAPDDGSPYLPSQVRFGRIGVKIKSNSKDEKPCFDYISRGEFVQTAFSTLSLQEPCMAKFKETESGGDFVIGKVDKIRQVGYADPNNSECLEFSVYVTPGTLVGQVLSSDDSDGQDQSSVFVPYHYAYWNPSIGEYEAMITEIALTSERGVLLARVLLDGEVNSEEYFDSNGKSLGTYPVAEDPDGEFTPIVQSQSSTVVITWRIGIVSVGKNDKVVTQADLAVNQIARELASYLIENYTITKFNDQSPVSHNELRDRLEDKVNDVLNGSVTVDLKGD